MHGPLVAVLLVFFSGRKEKVRKVSKRVALLLKKKECTKPTCTGSIQDHIISSTVLMRSTPTDSILR